MSTLAHAGPCWFMLAHTGSAGSRRPMLANSGLRWPTLAHAGTRWPMLVHAGSCQSTLALLVHVGSRWPMLANTGTCRHMLAHAGSCRPTLAKLVHAGPRWLAGRLLHTAQQLQTQAHNVPVRLLPAHGEPRICVCAVSMINPGVTYIHNTSRDVYSSAASTTSAREWL